MSDSYPTLTGSPDSIRLLKLLPGYPGQTISCTAHAVNLSEKPKYIAVSYTWGPEYPAYDILLNAQRFRVRENLWHFLNRIRPEDHSLMLWCDQLCIDQQNELEKSHQVENMGQTYRTAEETWVWLGELSPKMSTTMRFLSRIAKIYDQIVIDVNVLNKGSSGDWWISNREGLGARSAVFAQELELLLNTTRARDYDRGIVARALQQTHSNALWEMVREIVKVYQDLYPSACPAVDENIHALIQELGSREYWQRAWIIQELLLSRTITIYAGSMSIPFWIFRDLTTYQVSSVLEYTYRISHISEKSRHISVFAWPLSHITAIVQHYHPTWKGSFSTHALGEVEQLFNHERWPQTEFIKSRIAAASSLTKLKTDIARAGTTSSTVLTLQNCFKLVSKSHCFDWRDKIYSVLAINADLVDAPPFPIDYSCSWEQLFFNTLKSSFLERLLMERAKGVALALSVNLNAVIQARQTPARLREASTASNDGISVVSWGPHGTIHRIAPQENGDILSLGIRFEFGSPSTIEVKVYMHEENVPTPGHWIFRASMTCYAIMSSNTAGAAIIGWALLLGHDIAYDKFEYQKLSGLKLHDYHGRGREYGEKHLCLNEKQVLIVLSTEVTSA